MSGKVANTVIDTLVALGVERIYGIPGDSLNPLMDAIRQNPGIKFIQARHEEGAALEAAFESKFTGKVTVCVGTSGPGSIHLLNGLYDAKMEGVPVIALTGQVETDLIGSDYFQEINTNRLFDDVSIFNERIVNPENAGKIVLRAYREALYKRGVAHINLPVDVLRLPAPKLANVSPEMFPRVDFFPDLTTARNAINKSKKPVLFIGRGCTGLEKELYSFSDSIGAPIVYALNGKGIVDDYDPRVMGSIGLLGTKPSVDAFRDSDLLVMIGTSFPYVQFIPEGVKKIQVDIDPNRLGKRVPVNISLVCTSKYFLDNIKPDIKKGKFYSDLESAKEKWIKDQVAIESKKSDPILPESVAAELSKKAASDAVIIGDTGNVTVWTVRNFRTNAGRKFIYSSWLGSMGVGIPGAVGVSFATDRQVIALVGDGSFAMTMMELITAAKYERPIKIVVFNNSKLGMIKFEEEVMGYPDFGVDLYPQNFAAIASAIGIKGIRVEKYADLPESVSDFLSTSGPAVLDVVVSPDERPMPPKLQFSQVKGYVTSILRENLSFLD
ncbi:MAG: pyruvate dehydrogenase [Thermoplasmatales archaeon B_DKE]|nr:MAG: pyruvate dehydrogenase [Thermoplasmatales archaeon B_DKE]